MIHCGFESHPAYNMERKLRFFKQDGKWYADVPNHTLEENEMVMGADTALDYLAREKNEVNITLADEYPGWNTPFVLYRGEHDDEGAYYRVDGLLFMDFVENVMPDMMEQKPEIWICNVTHDVFGEHPEVIYVLKVRT